MFLLLNASEKCVGFFFTARLEWEEFTKSSPSFFCFFKPQCADVFPWVLLQAAVPHLTQPRISWWSAAPRTVRPPGGDTEQWPGVRRVSGCPDTGRWPCAAGPLLWASTSAKRQEQPDEACQRVSPSHPQRLVIRRPTADRHGHASCQQAAVHLDGRSRWAHGVKMTGDPAAAAALEEGGGRGEQRLFTAHKAFGTWPVGRCGSWNSHSTGSGGRITLLKATLMRYGIDGCGFIRPPCQNKGLLFTFYCLLIITECQTDCLAKLGQKTCKVGPTVRLETSGLTTLKYFSLLKKKMKLQTRK